MVLPFLCIHILFLDIWDQNPHKLLYIHSLLKTNSVGTIFDIVAVHLVNGKLVATCLPLFQSVMLQMKLVSDELVWHNGETLFHSPLCYSVHLQLPLEILLFLEDWVIPLPMHWLQNLLSNIWSMYVAWVKIKFLSCWIFFVCRFLFVNTHSWKILDW